MAINWESPIELRDSRNGNWFWIGREIWEDDRLTSSDKVIYGTIAFYANQFDQSAFPSLITFAKFSKLSNRQIYLSLKKLEKLNYINVKRESGKVNIYTLLRTPANFAPLQNNTGTPAKSHRVPLQNNTTNNNNINNNKLTTLSTKVLKGENPQKFGNEDINLCMDQLTQLLGNKPTKESLNRFAVKRLIAKLGSTDRVIAAIQYAWKIREEDRYAPRIYNYMDLEEKLEHLKGYGKQRNRGGKVYDATDVG